MPRFTCATCHTTHRADFRETEPYRCKDCRRQYNAKRKQALRKQKK